MALTYRNSSMAKRRNDNYNLHPLRRPGYAVDIPRVQTPNCKTILCNLPPLMNCFSWELPPPFVRLNYQVTYVFASDVVRAIWADGNDFKVKQKGSSSGEVSHRSNQNTLSGSYQISHLRETIIEIRLMEVSFLSNGTSFLTAKWIKNDPMRTLPSSRWIYEEQCGMKIKWKLFHRTLVCNDYVGGNSKGDWMEVKLLFNLECTAIIRFGV